jgi:putative Mg2+ transporter-C (MgtC) family protein
MTSTLLLSYPEVATRLIAAVLAGSLVGVERYKRGHPAGMRTFALVSLTSALLTASLSTETFGLLMGTTENGGSRIVQGVLSGIGFIGAGVIVREGLTIRGLTSAASIWAVASIGILIGSGEITIGFMGAFLVLIILMVFRWVDQFIPRRSYSTIQVKFSKDSIPDEAALSSRLQSYGFNVLTVSYKGAKSGTLLATISVWADGLVAEKVRAHLAQAFHKDSEVLEFSVQAAQLD